MRKIEPFLSKEDAIQTLDNGGRFFHLKAKANDGIISSSELEKAGGIFNDKQQMILFLEMSMYKLNQPDKEIILSNLEEDIKASYKKYKSQELLPSEANAKGEISSNAIIKGIPRLIDSKSEFQGFLLMPIFVDDVTTFMMVSLFDEYDVYEVREEESSEIFLIAHAKETEKLPDRKIIMGGRLKEYSPDESGEAEKGKYLELLYHIDH